MTPSASRLTPVLLVACSACRIDGSIGRAESGGLDDAAEAAITGGTDVPVSSGEGETGAMSAGGSGSAGGSTDTAVGGTEGASGDTGTPHACIVVADDTPCEVCRKTSCCDPLDACLSDTACTCTWECVGEGLHTQDECAMGCGDDGVQLDQLHDCAADLCAESCASPLDDGP
jgi:hypothetical protein